MRIWDRKGQTDMSGNGWMRIEDGKGQTDMNRSGWMRIEDGKGQTDMSRNLLNESLGWKRKVGHEWKCMDENLEL